MEKLLQVSLEHLKKLGVNEEYVIYICHGGDLKAAKTVLAWVKEVFENVETQFMGLSPAMITHGGPGYVLIQSIKK